MADTKAPAPGFPGEGEKPKRKHVATGKKPPGGRKNPPGGRPKGVTNALGYGEVKAIQVARLRVPDSATPEAAAIADRAFQRLVDVMEEGVSSFHAGNVLKAATRIRDEICRPPTQSHEHTGEGGGPILFQVNGIVKEGKE